MPHVYADILDAVQKPVRYIGNEWNVIKKPWETVRKHVLLGFPDSYDIGMSHLGLRILYSYLNQRADTAAERAFCPWLDMEAKLREKKLPLVSMESQRPLRDFEVVGFSLQYELEYSNVLTMLELGNIPLLSAERADRDPLVIGGGPCVYSAEPIADFFDCFLVGEGEDVEFGCVSCVVAGFCGDEDAVGIAGVGVEVGEVDSERVFDLDGDGDVGAFVGGLDDEILIAVGDHSGV